VYRYDTRNTNNVEYTIIVVANFNVLPTTCPTLINSNISATGIASGGVAVLFNCPNPAQSTIYTTLVGGGGSGGYGYIAPDNTAYAGGGGGGGGRSYSSFTPIPGMYYNLAIGAGGVAPTTPLSDGGQGGATTLTWTDSNGTLYTIATAQGGLGGGAGKAGGGGAGGAGGTAIPNSIPGAKGGNGGITGQLSTAGQDGTFYDVLPNYQAQQYSGSGAGGYVGPPDAPNSIYLGGLGGGGGVYFANGSNGGRTYTGLCGLKYIATAGTKPRGFKGFGYSGLGGGGGGGSIVTSIKGINSYGDPAYVGGSGLVVFAFLTDQS
jgi:hypothetical protein